MYICKVWTLKLLFLPGVLQYYATHLDYIVSINLQTTTYYINTKAENWKKKKQNATTAQDVLNQIKIIK